ncbi:hypothetical protein A0H77_19435 [Vibrio alginolyticus]|uniref:hypothetical protein n=1 Tax=Vibrio alginolyticus TaxID=663 RepID=UPI0007912356|nr:hypothetical protein [Vibrio alginolyticus]KXZ35071.1 hypothetical protein A0H77_19435 [Vibrio alginolyticus]
MNIIKKLKEITQNDFVVYLLATSIITYIIASRDIINSLLFSIPTLSITLMGFLITLIILNFHCGVRAMNKDKKSKEFNLFVCTSLMMLTNSIVAFAFKEEIMASPLTSVVLMFCFIGHFVVRAIFDKVEEKRISK